MRKPIALLALVGALVAAGCSKHAEDPSASSTANPSTTEGGMKGGLGARGGISATDAAGSAESRVGSAQGGR